MPHARIMKVAIVGLLILATTGPALAEGVALVSEGEPNAVIVLPANASASQQWAARELQDHVRLMSGAELPIGAADAADVAVLLGEAAAPLISVDEVGELGLDGYIIRTAPGKLAIAGTDPRGTLYGVYTLLEELGVRWWTPTETFVPEAKTVTVAETDLADAPILEYRDMMYNELWADGGKLWYARNKVNGMAWADAPAKLGDHYEFVGNLVHSYNILLQASGHEITEEMKALVNGKRTTAQPCLSDPGTLDAMVDAVLKMFEQNPDARFVVVGQMDNSSYCRCEDCAAIDEKEGSHAGQVIRFANWVAERVEKERPGSAICTAAYQWSRKPPKNLRPRDNVYITLCSIECDFAHPLATAETEVNAAFREDMERWGEIASRIYVWDYVTNYRHHLMPHPNLDVLVPNIRFFAENGCRGVFEQGAHKAHGSEFIGLRMWLLAKGLWNPQADGRKLIEEFVDGYYGAAAPHVLRYIDIIHDPVRQRPEFALSIYQLMDGPYLAPEVMAEAEATLRKAAEAAEGDPVLERRVRHARMPVWHMLGKRGPGSPTWKAVGELDFARVADGFATVVEENHINAIADGEVVGPWVEWLKAYAEQVADGTIPVPPELEGRDPSTYRLVQGCQFDGRGRWYTAAEGASDGWAVKQPTAGWTVRLGMDKPDIFQEGKSYRLKVRARCDLKDDAEGQAWNGGVWRGSEGKAPARARVSVETAAGGKWHVVDMGTFEPREGDVFYFANNGPASEATYVDCLWLEEVTP